VSSEKNCNPLLFSITCPVTAKKLDEWETDCPGPGARRGLARLLVRVKIACSLYIFEVICLIHVLLSDTENNEEGTEEVLIKTHGQ
jgi:hypothetical protein